MKCPRCDIQLYRSERIEEDLEGLRCTACEGLWIGSSHYWAWYEAHRGDPARPGAEEAVDVPEAKVGKGKLCPECRALLLPGRVGRGHRFSIDRCGLCGGFWFDRKEWEALRAAGLHREVPDVFTSVWQRNVRRDRTREVLSGVYRERFDGPTLARLQETHRWIHAHPMKEEIISFLLDEEPYDL